MVMISRRGMMLVLSSPSGAGKTTLASNLLASFQDDSLSMSVSATTRKPRADEKEGEDYYFVTPERFKNMRAQGAFMEHAEVFNNHYGTPRADVEKALDNGQDVLFDIDWQGAKQLAETNREDLVSIFILPPSAEILEKRLRGRARDSEEVIIQRMHAASREISHYDEYDYTIVNDRLEVALESITLILHAERLKRFRQKLDLHIKSIQTHLENKDTK